MECTHTYTYVADFGAVGDGVANDNTPFLSAISYAKENGATTLVLSPDKDYVVTALLEVSGLNIIGNNSRILRSGPERIMEQGEQGAYYNLACVVHKGDSWMTLPEELIGELSEGDIVKILSEEICDPTENVRFGEMHKINRIIENK